LFFFSDSFVPFFTTALKISRVYQRFIIAFTAKSKGIFFYAQFVNVVNFLVFLSSAIFPKSRKIPANSCPTSTPSHKKS
jgi:hypothetical protein